VKRVFSNNLTGDGSSWPIEASQRAGERAALVLPPAGARVSGEVPIAPDHEDRILGSGGAQLSVSAIRQHCVARRVGRASLLDRAALRRRIETRAPAFGTHRDEQARGAVSLRDSVPATRVGS
jgi:hypothetical protein